MKSGLNLYNATTSFEIDCIVEKYIAVARNSEEVSRQCWERFASGKSRAQARKSGCESHRRLSMPIRWTPPVSSIYAIILSESRRRARLHQREYLFSHTTRLSFFSLYISRLSPSVRARIVDASQQDKIRLALSWEC